MCIVTEIQCKFSSSVPSTADVVHDSLTLDQPCFHSDIIASKYMPVSWYSLGFIQDESFLVVVTSLIEGTWYLFSVCLKESY